MILFAIVQVSTESRFRSVGEAPRAQPRQVFKSNGPCLAVERTLSCDTTDIRGSLCRAVVGNRAGLDRSELVASRVEMFLARKKVLLVEAGVWPRRQSAGK